MSVYRSANRPAASLLPLIQALSLALLFALPTVWSAKVFTASPARYDHVLVHRGDSLWSLVSKHASRADDVAEAVYQAAAINHMQPIGFNQAPWCCCLTPNVRAV